MGRKSRRREAEARGSIENPTVAVSAANFLAFFGQGDGAAAPSVAAALGVPAVWAAVNFLSGTLAGLPLHLYRKSRQGRERVPAGRSRDGQLSAMLHYAPNGEMSSFDWRKLMFDQLFTVGRGLSFIDRGPDGEVLGVYPMEAAKTMVRRDGRALFYDYRGAYGQRTFAAADVIDVGYMLESDRVRSRSPLVANGAVIGMAIEMTRYAARFFGDGGVPPFVIEGPFQSPGAMQRAADDLAAAVRKAASDRRHALALPPGHTIKALGIEPQKSQMIEAQRFVVEQIARIYQLPPTFLQDLSHGTYSNTEQQDLHFVKHTLKRWVEQFEQELNLKLFGRFNDRLYAEMAVDGLLRGDFKARMDGYSTAIQNGVLTPNEARAMENRPDAEGGDRLYIQGATVPLASAGAAPDQASGPVGAAEDESDDSEGEDDES
jgi:HK97 family phage portal protein